MISTRILPDRFSIGILENGNAALMAQDTAANTELIIELSPEAWRQLLQNAPRMKGIGVPLLGKSRFSVVGGDGGEGG